MARCHLPLGTLAVIVSLVDPAARRTTVAHSLPAPSSQKWTPMARPMSGATYSLALTIGGLG